MTMPPADGRPAADLLARDSAFITALERNQAEGGSSRIIGVEAIVGEE